MLLDDHVPPRFIQQQCHLLRHRRSHILHPIMQLAGIAGLALHVLAIAVSVRPGHISGLDLIIRRRLLEKLAETSIHGWGKGALGDVERVESNALDLAGVVVDGDGEDEALAGQVLFQVGELLGGRGLAAGQGGVGGGLGLGDGARASEIEVEGATVVVDGDEVDEREPDGVEVLAVHLGRIGHHGRVEDGVDGALALEEDPGLGHALLGVEIAPLHGVAIEKVAPGCGQA